MNCYRCGAATNNGLALCELCRRKAALGLEFVPVYFRNLSRWSRPARPNGSLGTSGQWLIRAGESEGNRIEKALDHAGNMLTTWARTLSDDRGIEVPGADDEAAQAVAICEWLTEHLTTIATLEWCGQFARDMDRHEAILRELTEVSVPGWYAGGCRQCGYATHVVPGLTWVTCSACGATTYAKDHLPVILTEARTWLAKSMEIAEALVALLDSETDAVRLNERIRKWGVREQLIAEDAYGYNPRLGYSYDYDPSTAYRYRLGDVLDLIQRDTRRVSGEAVA